MNRWWLAAVAVALVFLVVEPSAGAAEKTSPAKKPAAGVKDAVAEKGKADKTPPAIGPTVFAMEEVSAFAKEEVDGATRYSYPGGSYTSCNTVPNKQVKAYPKLKSKHPQYGTVTFDGAFPGAKAGKTYHFVLDESGEKAPDADKEKSEKAGEKKPNIGYMGPMPGVLKHDLLYFDSNGDLDLTNDGVVKLARKPPFEEMPQGMGDGFFDDLKLMFDFGPGLGERPFAIVPHALSYGSDLLLVQFMPKTARKGKIRLGGKEYMARLCQSRAISGRYDKPMVQLELSPVKGSKEANVRPVPLGQLHWVDEHFVAMSATPLGDKLTVEPYRGELGVLKVGPGGRPITELGITGQLVSSKGVMIAMGDAYSPGSAAMPRQYSLPVGDYMLPAFMAQHGRLRFAGRMANIAPPVGQRIGEPQSFPIQIRKDKPFVLEFSGKPDVKFLDPAKDRTFKPGQTVRIAAMLNEPWQGVQITGLWDTTKSKGPSGGARLDPNIAIRDSTGKVVTEGKMPFG